MRGTRAEARARVLPELTRVIDATPAVGAAPAAREARAVSRRP